MSPLASASPSLVPRAAAALALLAVAVLLAGCGGGAGGGRDIEERDVEATLDRAFGTSIASADLSIDAQLEIEGLEGLDSPVRLEASGPYVRRERTLPLLDLDVTFGVPDAGQAIEAGFLSTGDRAFLEFAGEYYEQPAGDVERANRDLRTLQGSRAEGSVRALGLDLREWVVDARAEGDDQVGDVPTEHVSARLDARAVLADLNRLVERSRAAVGGPTFKAAPLPEAELDELADLFEITRFDVYVGREDSRIRRMSANLELAVPEDQRERFSGAESGSLRVSIELRDVNGDQRVEAPASPRPIADLATQLEGIGALGGAGGLVLPDGAAPEPGDPRDPDGAAGGQAAPDLTELEALQRYDECLGEAAPDDTAALTRCSSLLPPR